MKPNSGPAASQSLVPLFHAAWLFALGIASTRWFQPRSSLILAALALLALLCALAAWRAQRVVWLPLAAFWILLGSWCARMEPQPAPAPDLLALSDNLLRTVEGTVTDAAPMRNEMEQDLDEPDAVERPAQRIDLRVSSLEIVTDQEDAQTPIEGGVRLTVHWPASAVAASPEPASLQCGDRIRAVVRLLPPERYRDPGVWSREDFLLDQGITSIATVNVDRVERLAPAQMSLAAAWNCRVRAWQQTASARLLALPAAMRGLPASVRLSPQDAILLAAMVTGDRTSLTHSLRVGFERTGSFHMLVVSGFHLAVVAGCIFWLARRLKLPRLPATLATIALSFGYALFTGFATPVQRSFWMVTLYLLARLFYRERNPMNTIGFAALCLLAISPRSLFDSSFQMTLLAVVAIAGIVAPLLEGTLHPYVTATRELRVTALDVKLAPRLAEFRVILRALSASMAGAVSRRIGWQFFPWMVRFGLRCAELIVVACVVELAMTLPMALYFHRITLYALPVNLLVLPLMLLLIPTALITLLTLVAWPSAAFVPAMVTAFLIHLGEGMVRIFGSLAWGDFRIPTPLAWQSAAFCALLAAAVALARSAAHARWRRRLAVAALLTAAFVSVVPRPIDHPRDALLFEAIDVGQGDSLLLITPEGKTLLVDGGGFGGGPRQAPQAFDIGEEVVSQALWSRGIRHLDAVALTHAHSDHMGGLPAVLGNFHPDELWVGNNPRFAAYNALLDEAAELHVRVRSLRTGDALTLGSAQIRVLAPFHDYQPGPQPANNDSLVMQVSYKATSVLLEGDAEAPIEEEMLAEPGLESTVLKVGHHGSITSTRPEFLARVHPAWAVISCGLHNRYGHPRQEVLEELQTAKVRTLSTDINGIICLRLNGKTVAPESPCQGR